jgi:hypothetical protein
MRQAEIVVAGLRVAVGAEHARRLSLPYPVVLVPSALPGHRSVAIDRNDSPA